MDRPGWFPVALADIFFRPQKVFSALRQDRQPPGFMLFAAVLLIAGAAGRTLTGIKSLDPPPSVASMLDEPALPVFLFFAHVAVFIITWYAGSWLIGKLVPPFGGTTNRQSLWKLIVIAYTPFMLAQPLTALPGPGHWAGFAALVYTVILFAWGAGYLGIIPRKKITGFTLLAFFILLGISFILTNFISRIFVGLYIFT